MSADAETDYTQMMKTELVQLIDALELDELSKRFLRSRWLDQLIWMEGACRKNQRFYYLFRLTCIIGGILIPAVVGWSQGVQAAGIFHIITAALSLLVAVSAAVEEFFHFGERWRHYRRTAELLKGEGWAFFQLSGPYATFDHHTGAYAQFAGRVEEAFQKEVEIFVTKISKEVRAAKKTSNAAG